MPFQAKDIPPKAKRNVVIQLKGPKASDQIKRLNYELKRIAKKYGARFKRRRKS